MSCGKWDDSKDPEDVWYDSNWVWIDSNNVREFDESF